MLAVRAFLVLALLTQQLAVWPCLSICRMVGCTMAEVACSEASACCDSECEPPSPCATACQSLCPAACTDSSADPVDASAGCECGPIGYLACAAAAQPLDQAPPAAPSVPHRDLIQLLTLPVGFIAFIDFHQNFALTHTVEWAWRSPWVACPPRSMLCCWMI